MQPFLALASRCDERNTLLGCVGWTTLINLPARGPGVGRGRLPERYTRGRGCVTWRKARDGCSGCPKSAPARVACPVQLRPVRPLQRSRLDVVNQICQVVVEVEMVARKYPNSEFGRCAIDPWRHVILG